MQNANALHFRGIFHLDDIVSCGTILAFAFAS